VFGSQVHERYARLREQINRQVLADRAMVR
jgi:hypothetical protein